MLLFKFFIFPILAYSGFFEDRLQEFVSPVTTNAKYTLISGSLLTGLFLIDGVPNAFGEQYLVDNKPLGEFSKVGYEAGQLWVNAVYIGATYGVYLINKNAVYKSRSLHMLKSSIYAATWTELLKRLVREPRPNNPNSLLSFPSGHATHAFAFASVIATEHEWYWVLTSYLMATLVAISRVNDNAHRLHDVIAGATIGVSYGLAIHQLNKNKKNLDKFSFMPLNQGLMITYSSIF